MKPIAEHHPLRRFFRGLVEDAFFAQVGLPDPELVDYLSEMLVNFVHVDRMYVLRDAKGRRLYEVAEILENVTQAEPVVPVAHELRIHRHIGDLTLFWSGVYPEHLQRSTGLAFKDRLLDYAAQGKRSYAIASRLADEDTSPPASLLGRLSRHYEFCCHGLGIVRRGFQRDAASPVPPNLNLLY